MGVAVTAGQPNTPNAQLLMILRTLFPFDFSLDRFTGSMVIHFQGGIAMEARPTPVYRLRKTK